MVGWEVMDQEEDAPEQRPRSQRDLSQQKISITDSCLPFSIQLYHFDCVPNSWHRGHGGWHPEI